MKTTHILLLFALFGHTSARLNEDGVDQDQTRALGDDPEDVEFPIQLEAVPIADFKPLGLGLPSEAAPPLVSVLAEGDDADELDILVTFKNNSGMNTAKEKAKKVNQEIRLGNIIAVRATRKEIREMELDADIE
jgi:hypothetical protein